MKNKGLKITLGILLLLVIIILAGPRMPKPKFNPELPAIPVTSFDAGTYVDQKESRVPNVRPENSSKVIYANDSLRDKTPYCLVYLHGFSASPKEGAPIHINLAREFQMNAYIPRLAEHGLDTPDPLLNMTPDALWESVKEALVIGKLLGNKIILMGTSTGGTLAIKAAAEYPDDIAALILLSPNVRIKNKASSILARPWGLQLGRQITGGKFRILEEDSVTDAYWYNRYRVEGLVYLQQMVEATMKESVFEKVKQPVFVGYYYKDEENQDQTVSVPAILWMFEKLGTPSELKVAQAFPDAGAHVIGCELTNSNWPEVYKATEIFLRGIPGLEILN